MQYAYVGTIVAMGRAMIDMRQRRAAAAGLRRRARRRELAVARTALRIDAGEADLDRGEFVAPDATFEPFAHPRCRAEGPAPRRFHERYRKGPAVLADQQRRLPVTLLVDPRVSVVGRNESCAAIRVGNRIDGMDELAASCAQYLLHPCEVGCAQRRDEVVDRVATSP